MSTAKAYTDRDIDEMLAKARLDVIPSNLVGDREGVTRGQLSDLFDCVKNKAHWKNPIDANVYLTDDDAELLSEAIIFFTGSAPTIERIFKMKFVGVRNLYHVKAEGYFRTIGA